MIKTFFRILTLAVCLVSAGAVLAQDEVPTPPPAPLGAQAEMPQSARHLKGVWVPNHWERHKWVQGHYVYYKKYSPMSWVSGHWEYRPRRGPAGWSWVSGHWQGGRDDDYGPGMEPGMGPGMGPGSAPGSAAPGAQGPDADEGPGSAPGAEAPVAAPPAELPGSSQD